MTARKPRTSATELPAALDVDWCARQAARLLLEAESPVADSDARGRNLELAEAWRELADSIRGD